MAPITKYTDEFCISAEARYGLVGNGLPPIL